MSIRRIDYEVTLEIFAGTRKDFELVIEDPSTGEAKDLSDTNTYNDGNVKIVKPDGTIITTVSITYNDRPNGIVGFTIDETVATNDNAGNWIGNVELINNVPKTIDQQLFNFNILENF